MRLTPELSCKLSFLKHLDLCPPFLPGSLPLLDLYVSWQSGESLQYVLQCKLLNSPVPQLALMDQGSPYQAPPTWKPPSLEINWDALLPPPSISDPVLLEQDPSHKTWTIKERQPLGLTKESLERAELNSYKRLELLGDSVISAFLLPILIRDYPRFTTSALSVSFA
jgi:hypothetical protein